MPADFPTIGSLEPEATPAMEKTKRSIFSIVGLPPEVLAVAMAKYSRSVESIKDTIDDLTEEKSAQFHEKWVLGYGDASVADMAVVAFALENISILASKAVEDNRLASYQEKSTRYVKFDIEKFYRPPAVLASSIGDQYEATIQALFAAYEEVSRHTQLFYRNKYPRTADQSEAVYETRIKARALDIARYVLPTATLTNFGMIMSARSLRHAISKLKGSPTEEFRAIGEEIQRASTEPAYNPQTKRLDPLFEELRTLCTEAKGTVDAVQRTIKLQISGAPTLVRRTEPRPYFASKETVMKELAEGVLLDVPIVTLGIEKRADMYDQVLTPEDELISTLLYAASRHSFRAIATKVRSMTAEAKKEILEKVQALRGQYDWPCREFEVGQGFIFDTLMDYGAFRDLQRHRICTQINQELGPAHGYEIPRDLDGDGLQLYQRVMTQAAKTYDAIAAQFPGEAAYILPLAYRKRTLFKMNLRELYHIVELRTKPGGHFSYRELVYDMFEQFRKLHPMLAADMRAVKMDFDDDFFKR
mmetsp:Transcript_33295/g.54003  ORF Transcript_33295/g.54003 Transcript_33295/m.54003 type:complete len:531 (+) Transcript_33295:164-1756(+)|eukprot:CAMPEP_0184675762 /NCGR_PEP_ID=MMETSP0308-20130426/87971_1 /TAXON_ID=38269 /ORGANISM="Gloeochaete witrockiana, Strain SAG 46.84" /LENGTH=530 /DNA_ID=CAMNT_0027123509 /DNA_START=119 /DNA_END=1711 /DNA_ORIENTATION=-